MKCFLFIFVSFVPPWLCAGGKEGMYEGTERWPRMKLSGCYFIGTHLNSLRAVLLPDPCSGLIKERDCGLLWKAWNMFGAGEQKCYVEMFHAHSQISKSYREKSLSPAVLSLCGWCGGGAAALHWGGSLSMRDEIFSVLVLQNCASCSSN